MRDLQLLRVVLTDWPLVSPEGFRLFWAAPSVDSARTWVSPKASETSV